LRVGCKVYDSLVSVGYLFNFGAFSDRLVYPQMHENLRVGLGK